MKTSRWLCLALPTLGLCGKKPAPRDQDSGSKVNIPGQGISEKEELDRILRTPVVPEEFCATLRGMSWIAHRMGPLAPRIEKSVETLLPHWIHEELPTIKPKAFSGYLSTWSMIVYTLDIQARRSLLTTDVLEDQMMMATCYVSYAAFEKDFLKILDQAANRFPRHHFARQIVLQGLRAYFFARGSLMNILHGAHRRYSRIFTLKVPEMKDDLTGWATFMRKKLGVFAGAWLRGVTAALDSFCPINCYGELYQAEISWRAGILTHGHQSWDHFQKDMIHMEDHRPDLPET
ncbi:hypothetical protein CDD80_690 [Ophiocordyceps camponoti-rufipedis]|uniref:ER-bound oxygenase mpaB/mpaB'/Rubber oxygenase catalytic domain-containing protein n=1 Tax=Ophiocordyceps camponoti-rufipedis TaxID=2004952 RepID=A0A2C5ZCA7_9HYPO|nr:hypothetical protein CDD80_690 [Ophiocordyceps camponoti-rufipedis]